MNYKQYVLVTCMIMGASVNAQSYIDHAAPNQWEGFYIGGYLGGAWGEAKFHTDAGGATPRSYFSSPADIESVNQSGQGRFNESSFYGGIQAGDNLLVGQFLYGAVVDFGAFGLNHYLSAVNVPFPSNPTMHYTLNTSITTDYLMTARGNLGYILLENLNVYATGGIAVTQMEVINEYQDATTSARGDHAKNKAGWTLGAGLHVPLSQHFFINAEYLYVAFAALKAPTIVNCPDLSCQSPLDTAVDLAANVMKLELNYKF